MGKDPLAGADPGYFLGGGAPLGKGVTDWCGEQILKAYSKKKALSQWIDAHLCTLPLDPPMSLNS